MYVTITNPAALYVSALHQAKETWRPYLRGVNVEPHADGGVLLVATDGYRMSVSRDADAEHENIGNRVILPVPSSLLPALKKRDAHRAVWRDDVLGGVLSVEDEGGGVLAMAPCRAIDAEYLDWRKVFGATPEPADYIAFDANYLAEYKKIAAAIKCRAKVTFTPSGPNGPTLLTFGNLDWWVGLLMPMTSGKNTAPRWLVKKEASND